MQARPAPVALEDLVVLVLTLLFLVVPLLVGVVRAIRKEVENARRGAAPGEAVPGGERPPQPPPGQPPRTAPVQVTRQAPAWTEPLRSPVPPPAPRPTAAGAAAAGREAEPREAHRAPPRLRGGWTRLERLPALQRGLLLAELLGPPVALREEGLPPLRPPPRLSGPAGGAPPGASPAATPRRA